MIFSNISLVCQKTTSIGYSVKTKIPTVYSTALADWVIIYLLVGCFGFMAY